LFKAATILDYPSRILLLFLIKKLLPLFKIKYFKKLLL